MPADPGTLHHGIDGLFPLTEDELLAEWRYRYKERIAILCDGKEPTQTQDRMARDEADAAVEMMSRYKAK